MTEPVTTVMISCRQRVTDRRRTIEAFHRIGLHPEVILSECNPAGGMENARTAHKALQVAASQPARRPALFIEDDLELADDFREHLTAALELDAITYLYMTDTPSRLHIHHGSELAERILRGEAIPWGPRELANPAQPYGTQAVVIPGRLIGTMVELTRPPGHHAFDTRLRMWLEAEHAAGRERIYTSLPHPVQHRNGTAGREEPTYTRRERISLSYGLPSTRV